MQAATQEPRASPLTNETQLRHPLERPVFIASVILNFALLGAAIVLLVHPPDWEKKHPIIGKEIGVIRLLALTAIFGIPLLVLRRNRLEAYVRGNSVRLSRDQFPEVYALLEDHCRTLEMTKIPELFLTSETIRPYSRAYSSWKEDYIILHENLFEADYRKTLDVVSFTIGHELGAIRLGHTAVWNEMLLTYITAIKWLANPLHRIRVCSRDRYGAHLAPTGFRGLLILAAGRRLMDDVNIDEFLQQMRRYGSVWSGIDTFVEPVPQLFVRLQQLRNAGFTYRPR